MGIALYQSKASKGRTLFALLDSPILLALILSVAIHIAIWKILPNFESLPAGKSHGWMRVFLIDNPNTGTLNQEGAPDASQNNAIKLNTEPTSKSEAADTPSSLNHREDVEDTQPRLNGGYQGPFTRGVNQINLAPLEREVQVRNQPHWESRVRAEAIQRQSSVQQNLSLYAAQKQQLNPFGCELAFSGDFLQGYVKCNTLPIEQEIKASLASARITWQENKNGLVNERVIGQAILIKQ